MATQKNSDFYATFLSTDFSANNRNTNTTKMIQFKRPLSVERCDAGEDKQHKILYSVQIYRQHNTVQCTDLPIAHK